MSGVKEFKLEVLGDFIDDALLADHVLDDRDIEGMMSTLAAAGVKRVAWAYYGDGHGGLRMPKELKDGKADYGQCWRTYRKSGNPLQRAVEAGHRHGLDVYAYFKPYETGVSMLIPEGAPEAVEGLLRHQGGWLASRVDFRRWGLIFDYGWGRAVTALDVSNADGRSGIIAFARGRNSTLPAALCETEPLVQEFWLDCLREMIAAGVDGVDFREENHCTHTDDPEAYGFNPVVLAQLRPGEDLQGEVARIRGEAYTEFVRKAHDLLSTSGVRLRYHLNMDWFRPDPPACRALAYPANISFEWRRWIKEGLLDEAVLRSYHHRKTMLTDSFGGELVDACHGEGIPISFNHHIFDDNGWYLEEAQRIRVDGRFDGLILYEACSFLKMIPGGDCRFTLGIVKQICRRPESDKEQI